MGSRKKVLIEATMSDLVGYFDYKGQIGRGYPLEERPEEPPTGTVYEREYTLLKNVTDEDGRSLDRLNNFVLKVGPRKFLRGIPSPSMTMVIVKYDDIDIGVPLQYGDIPPPDDSSEYAVGESPEEIEAAEIEQIREDAKNGVYDEEEEAAVGGGHPVIPFSDDGPRVA